MTALIDTSVLVDGAEPKIDEPWVVSVITVGELEAGVLMASDKATRAKRLRLLTAVLAEAPADQRQATLPLVRVSLLSDERDAR